MQIFVKDGEFILAFVESYCVEWMQETERAAAL